MYRYSVDHAVTYTPDDVVLFRESPFAAWMERLTLENPDHGIPPDLNSSAAQDAAAGRDEIVATLRAEGRNVVLVDPELDEPERRTATLAAMRGGADFIVNGQLAVGTLSGRANLLMRTSGFSDLGDFLYIPCETLSVNGFQSTFRLCFTAELLRSLQGQLPPQMLIIRDSAEVVPLQTEDHIYYYRAVLQRFMLAMSGFRKHRMPDPAESAHFGRWSDCANEVLKQRAHAEQQRSAEQRASDAPAEDSAAVETPVEAVAEMPQLRVASGAGGMPSHLSSPYEFEVENQAPASAAPGVAAAYNGAAGHTLVEQARLLTPNSFSHQQGPGHTPNLARFGRPRAVAVVSPEKAHHRRSTDAALQNLEFVGSSATGTPIGDADSAGPLLEIDAVVGVRPPPAPNLRETSPADNTPQVKASPSGLPELEPRAPVFLPPDRKPVEPARERHKPEPFNNAGGKKGASSVMDLDSAPAPALAPVVQRAEAEFARIGLRDPMFRNDDQPRPRTPSVENVPAPKPFSDSLITSQEFNDS